MHAGIAHLDEVKTSLKDLVEWRELGLKLGILDPTLGKIERNRRGMVEECKREMLAGWLQRVDTVSEPTWTALVEALESIGERRLADEIKKQKVSLRVYNNKRVSIIIFLLHTCRIQHIGTIYHSTSRDGANFCNYCVHIHDTVLILICVL